MTSARKSKDMADARWIVGKKIDCAGSRLKLLTGTSIHALALIANTILAFQTIVRIASLMSARIVMTGKITAQTIGTTAAQTFPEVQIAPARTIHETTLQAVTCQEVTNALTFPRASRVLRVAKTVTTRAGKVAGSITPIPIPANVAMIAASAITAPETAASRRAMKI